MEDNIMALCIHYNLPLTYIISPLLSH